MARITPGRIDELKATVLTHIFMSVGRVINSLSDANLARFLTVVRSLSRDADLRDGLDEIIDAIRMGPPNTTLLRRMIAESRYDEVHDLIMGVFCFREMDPEDL